MRQARERLGVPQDKLGVMIGLDEETASARISRYETGVHEPQIAIARSIAKALKVPLAYLYCDEDELAFIIDGASRLSTQDRATLVESIQQRVNS
jgi:transcriptional regulator with XRE-family HTH domain